MAAAASFILRPIVAVCGLGANASELLAIDDFLSKSDLRRALKSWRGSSCKRRAMSRSGANSASAAPVAPASMASRAWSNRSWIGRLGIAALHLRAQALQGAELELLHCAFA